VGKADAIIVSCGEVLDISRVGEFYSELNMILNEEKPVQVDISKLDRIDIAGIQLLLSFSEKVNNLGYGFQWSAPSESLLRAVKLVGLTEQLGFSE